MSYLPLAVGGLGVVAVVALVLSSGEPGLQEPQKPPVAPPSAGPLDSLLGGASGLLGGATDLIGGAVGALTGPAGPINAVVDTVVGMGREIENVFNPPSQGPIAKYVDNPALEPVEIVKEPIPERNLLFEKIWGQLSMEDQNYYRNKLEEKSKRGYILNEREGELLFLRWVLPPVEQGPRPPPIVRPSPAPRRSISHVRYG